MHSLEAERSRRGRRGNRGRARGRGRGRGRVRDGGEQRGRGRGGVRGRGRGQEEINDGDRKEESESTVCNNVDMDVGRGAMDPQLQADEDALVIECKGKLYDGVITEAAKPGGVNAKQLNKRMRRKCQLKYARAKQLAGQPSKVILEINDHLQMMEIAKSILDQGMDVDDGGNRFDTLELRINTIQ